MDYCQPANLVIAFHKVPMFGTTYWSLFISILCTDYNWSALGWANQGQYILQDAGGPAQGAEQIAPLSYKHHGSSG